MEKMNKIMKMMESKRYMFEKQYEEAYEKSVACRTMSAENSASEIIDKAEKMKTPEEIFEFVKCEYAEIEEKCENQKTWIGYDKDTAYGKYDAVEEIMYGIKYIMES